MKQATETLIDLARQHLAVGDAQTAADCLACVLASEPNNLVAHNLREAHFLEGNYGSWMGVNAQIDPEDDIFRFFANHPTSRHPVRDYLSDGWRTMVELQSVMEMHGHVLGRSRSFLEFACGHGRFTRHLVKRLPKGALTVSDVVPGSVNFLQGLLGVKGFDSCTEPTALRMPENYEHIFVLSLFSHLPESTWGAWLKRLYEGLEPGGLLIISTHGQKCADQAGVNLDKGIVFFASSESNAIEGQHYGTTFTSADYVIATARRSIGSEAKVKIITNHFWQNQDAVIIQK